MLPYLNRRYVKLFKSFFIILFILFFISCTFLNVYSDISTKRGPPNEIPPYVCPFVTRNTYLLNPPVVNNLTENRALLLLESSSSRNGKLIAQLLSAKRLDYKIGVFSNNIPTLASMSRGSYSIIIIENYYKYLNMGKWSRQILDKYCSEYHVPIVSFVSSRVNDTFQRARIKGDSLYLWQNQKISALTVENSKIHKVLRIGAKRYEDSSSWVLFEKNENIELVVSAVDSRNRTLGAVVWNKGLKDGIQRIIFGYNLTDWLIKTTFHDVLWHYASFDKSWNLIRFIQVDIDDVFVGARGTRMVEDDVRNLIESQKEMRKTIENFTYTLGFSGSYFKNGDSYEDEADELLLKEAKTFVWFPHMWRHNHAHEYNGSSLTATMILNKKFSETMGIPVRYPYAIAPQHDGVFPVHEELFDSWKHVWNISVTATEEYPHFKPASNRRGFIFNNISVLPRQTCGLYTHTQFFHSYPDGLQKLINSIEGGELFTTILLNDISIFMTHQQNFAHDRLAVYTFENVIRFLKCWTNLSFKWQDPVSSATTYFQFHPQEKNPIWSNPCSDPRHRMITPPSIKCNSITLPNVLIVGPQKTGSTALASFLSLHPNVSTNPIIPESFEEIQFFGGTHYTNGLNWYMQWFHPAQIIFEKSATYFDNPDVPRQVAALLPDAKIVVLLYNPSVRAYSWYQHMLAHNDSTTLDAGNFETILDGKTVELRKIRQRCISGGRYTHHLERWLEYFPLSQILFIDGEELKENPSKVVGDLSLKLGLPKFDYTTVIRFSPSKKFFCRILNGQTKCLGGSKGRAYEPVSDSLRTKLSSIFRSDNISLQKFLIKNNLSVPHWLTQI